MSETHDLVMPIIYGDLAPGDLFDMPARFWQRRLLMACVALVYGACDGACRGAGRCLA